MGSACETNLQPTQGSLQFEEWGQAMGGKASYRLSESDLIESQIAWFNARLRLRMISIVFAAVAIVGAGLLLLDPFPGRSNVALMALPVAAAIALWLVLAASKIGIRKNVRRLAAQNRAYGLEQTVEWDEAGLRMSSMRGESRLRWADVHRWQATRGLLLLYLDDSQFHLLPRRAVSSAEMAEIVGLLEGAGVPRLGPRARLERA